MKNIYYIFCFILFIPVTTFALGVSVIVDTKGENINALSGEMNIPQGVEVTGIQTGDSSIVFWVKEPQVSNGVLSFAGVTPGGISGIAQLFHIEGSWSDEDVKSMQFLNVEAFKNDGLATKVPVTLLLSTQNEERGTDTQPPESFEIHVTRNKEYFDNKWFIVFTTQDKDSGISHYEVCEGKMCIVATSPYELQNQDRTDTIVVRAIDRAGNVTESSIKGTRNMFPILFIVIVLILIIVVRKIYVRR